MDTKNAKNTFIPHILLSMKNIFAIIALAIFFSSCKKETEELPPATQNGANTFGAKVNGELWVTRGFGPFPANDVLEARRFGNGDIIINARNFASSPTEKEFVIFVRGAMSTGVYPLNSNVVHPTFDASYAYYVKRKFTPENEWLTTTGYTGSVNLTNLDTINHIISGTFQFQMINSYNAPQPLTVTEGRFDIRLQ